MDRDGLDAQLSVARAPANEDLDIVAERAAEALEGLVHFVKRRALDRDGAKA